MHNNNVVLLTNNVDAPTRYNYEINFGWTRLYKNKWSIHETEGFGKYDCVFCISTFKRFTREEMYKWHKLLSAYDAYKVLRAGDTCYCDWRHPFYEIWDWILYRMPDKNGKYPENGSYLPWSIDPNKYRPSCEGKDIALVGTCNDAYPLRQFLIYINDNYFIDKTNLDYEEYLQVLRDSRAVICTGNVSDPGTRAKALEAAASGCVLITYPTEYLELYFKPVWDCLYIYDSKQSFIEQIKRVKDTDTLEQQQRIAEHIRTHFNHERVINEYIPANCRPCN